MDFPEIAYGVFPTGKIIMLSLTSDNRIKNHITGDVIDRNTIVTMQSLEEAVVYAHNILVDIIAGCGHG